MPALVAAVTTAQTQDLQERFKSGYEETPEGQGARNLADSEQYLEARKYIYYVAAVEVTDIRERSWFRRARLLKMRMCVRSGTQVNWQR